MPITYSAPALNPDFSLEKLIEKFNNKTFEIKAVRFGTSQFGEYAVVTVAKKDYVTSSGVLIPQLHEIKKLIEEHKDTVAVSMRQIKRYYTF